jgi:type VI secretion system protein ImpL
MERPQKTTITLTAPDLKQELENYNFPVSKAFVWKPGINSTTSLEIDFPSVTLYISYDGLESFPNFLNDLIREGFILKPSEFPDHKEQLESLGISEIRVIMKADGALPIINLLSLPRQPLPASIIKEK